MFQRKPAASMTAAKPAAVQSQMSAKEAKWGGYRDKLVQELHGCTKVVGQ